jgi:hypothetical protein
MHAKYQDDHRLITISSKYRIFCTLKLHTKHECIDQIVNNIQLKGNLPCMLRT